MENFPDKEQNKSIFWKIGIIIGFVFVAYLLKIIIEGGLAAIFIIATQNTVSGFKMIYGAHLWYVFMFIGLFVDLLGLRYGIRYVAQKSTVINKDILKIIIWSIIINVIVYLITAYYGLVSTNILVIALSGVFLIIKCFAIKFFFQRAIFGGMKKIIFAVVAIIIIILSGRVFWVYQQFKPLRDQGFLAKNSEIDRIKLGINSGKEWQGDATLYDISILKLPHAYAYASFEFFSPKSNSCYRVQINRRLEVVNTYEIVCDNVMDFVVLDIKNLSVDSADVILLLNWYAHYSKLTNVQLESTVSISLIKDEVTGKLAWVGQTWLTEWTTTSESLAPVIMVDAVTGKLLKTFVVKKTPDGKVVGDHYD